MHIAPSDGTNEIGWDESAEAWIRWIGSHGDWSRKYVLDDAMLARIECKNFKTALDVGCGEGRFCRLLKQRDIQVIGVDPTLRLVAEALHRDPDGLYFAASAETLPFADCKFELVVTYLSLVDIPDFRSALQEMWRVLSFGGSLLIANFTGFTSARPKKTDLARPDFFFPVDRYLDEFSYRTSWEGIRLKNWHRPLSAYMDELLRLGLVLRCFQEPQPTNEHSETAASYRRAPWFLVMEWEKSAVSRKTTVR